MQNRTKNLGKYAQKGNIPWNKGLKGVQISANKGKHFNIKHEKQFKKGMIPWNKNLKGIHLSPNSEFKKGIIPKNSFIFGKGTQKFKGSLSEYKQLHYQINRELGKPEVCSNCKGIFDGKKIHWANKSREYKKDLLDWIALCSKCHYQYDKQELRKIQYI